jgi:uncharacterized membrane protein affecting hemolysin expression
MNKFNNTHNYSIFKRISSLIVLILCVVIGVNLYFMHSQNAAKWYQVESEQLGRSLTLQAAKLIAAPLAKKDQEMLDLYVSVVNKGMFVKGAVLFDELGVRYAQQDDRLSVVDMLKQSDIEPLVFVEDIVFEGNIIGYIKLVLDKQAITEHHRNFNKNQLTQSILMIVLSFVAAALATRLFYKLRKSYQLVDSEDEMT